MQRMYIFNHFTLPPVFTYLPINYTSHIFNYLISLLSTFFYLHPFLCDDYFAASHVSCPLEQTWHMLIFTAAFSNTAARRRRTRGLRTGDTHKHVCSNTHAADPHWAECWWRAQQGFLCTFISSSLTWLLFRACSAHFNPSFKFPHSASLCSKHIYTCWYMQRCVLTHEETLNIQRKWWQWMSCL